MSSAGDGAWRTVALLSCASAILPKKQRGVFCIRDYFMLRWIEINASSVNFSDFSPSDPSSPRVGPIGAPHALPSQKASILSTSLTSEQQMHYILYVMSILNLRQAVASYIRS